MGTKVGVVEGTLDGRDEGSGVGTVVGVEVGTVVGDTKTKQFSALPKETRTYIRYQCIYSP